MNISSSKIWIHCLILIVSALFLSNACDSGDGLVENGVLVTNKAQLDSVISIAKPNDVIVMKNGTWEDVEINFDASATVESPVTLKAQTPGKVLLKGNSSLTFLAPHLVVDGLYFTEGSVSSNSVIEFKSDSCRLTNTAIIDYNPESFNTRYYWVFFDGNYNRMDYSYFKGKSNMQPLIGNNQDDSRHNRVDHCYFKDIPYESENGREIFRIWGYGRSEELGDDGAFFTIEHNLFDRTHGEGSEIISLKSNRNKVRYNTIRSTRGGIVGRSGNFNTIANNFILGNGQEGSAGIRVAGQGHRVVNNYIASVSEFGLILMAGEYIKTFLTDEYDPIEREGTPLGRVPRYGHVRNGLFAHNSWVDVGGPVLNIGYNYLSAWSEEQRLLLPENNRFINNLIHVPEDTRLFNISEQQTHPPLDQFEFEPNVFKGNLAYGDNYKEDEMPQGFDFVDRPLVHKQEGLFRPIEDSPAIDGGITIKIDIRKDMEGQDRTSAADVGADEFSQEDRIHPPLTPNDVGPGWMKH